jgi:hypothetical protein
MSRVNYRLLPLETIEQLRVLLQSLSLLQLILLSLWVLGVALRRVVDRCIILVYKKLLRSLAFFE